MKNAWLKEFSRTMCHCLVNIVMTGSTLGFKANTVRALRNLGAIEPGSGGEPWRETTSGREWLEAAGISFEELADGFNPFEDGRK